MTAFASPNEKDRILSAIRKLIFQECPTLAYEGLWEYVVTNTGDGTVDGSPTDPNIPLPPLAGLSVSALVSGGISQPTIGNRFLVEFRNQNGTNYAVVSADPTVVHAVLDAESVAEIGPSVSDSVMLGPNAHKPVARIGDGMTLFTSGCTFTGVLTTFIDGVSHPISSKLSLMTPFPGLIATGNNKVLA